MQAAGAEIFVWFSQPAVPTTKASALVVQEISSLKGQLQTASQEAGQLKAELQALNRKSTELQADLRQAEQAHDVANQQLEVSCVAGQTLLSMFNGSCAENCDSQISLPLAYFSSLPFVLSLNEFQQSNSSSTLRDSLGVCGLNRKPIMNHLMPSVAETLK